MPQREVIDMVEDFTYVLGLQYIPKVYCGIVKASKAFVCLREPVFLNNTLLVATKRAMYYV